MKERYLALLVTLFIFCTLQSYAQVTPVQDTSQYIEVLPGTKRLTFKTINDSTRLTIAVGNVRLKQGNSYMYCDSCVLNNKTNILDAWGRVHIRNNDSIDVYSNYLHYDGKTKKANLKGAVSLTDGKGKLTTPSLDYDLNTDIGVYKNTGKVYNKNTVLTSKEGYYYAAVKDVYFVKNVVLIDKDYHIKTDSLLYNTQSQITRFITYTEIRNGKRLIKTTDGNYNLQTGKAEFGKRPTLIDKGTLLIADHVFHNDSTKISFAEGKVYLYDSTNKTLLRANKLARDEINFINQAEGNVVINDYKDSSTLIAGLAFQNVKTDATLATNKPLLILQQNKDSIYIKADTLFSARLMDKFGKLKTDFIRTSTGFKKIIIQEKDSAQRYFEAYSHVRIFHDSLQAVCDSMFISSRDSILRLHKNPVIWAQGSQATGDTVLLFTLNRKPKKFEIMENAFLINHVELDVYNQVKSTRMDGWFIDGNIDSVRAAGNAKNIYFMQDSDSSYSGINESTSDILDVYFKNKEIFKIAPRREVSGTIWPIREKQPAAMRLTGFSWLEEIRPKSKFEMFE